MRSFTSRQACSTVPWSRPPKASPIDAERTLGHLPREEHGDLAREGDVFRAPLAGHVGQPDVEMLRHLLLDDFDADRVAAFLVQDFAQQALDHFERQLLAGERGVGGHADQRAFQPADVGADAVGEEIHDLLGQLDAHELRFLVAESPGASPHPAAAGR